MNILLNGYFDKNFGDDAMHQMVVEHFPEHNFYVNCNQQEMLAHLEGYKNVHINVQNTEIDMFLNVIGTGFMYNGKRSKLEKLFRIVTSKQKKYPKSALINCSLELFDGKVSQWLTKYDLSKYDFITCRDKNTYKYLSENIKNTQIEMHNDMVFSAGFCVADGDKEYLGIAPIRRLYSDSNFNYYREMAKFADNYIEKHNKKVRLFAFDSGLENDISAALSIKNMMKNTNLAEIIMYNSDIKYFAEKISECEFFVGSRFHSIIIALMNGIKTAAVFDNEKIKRLCADFDIAGVKKADFTYEKLIHCIGKHNFKNRDMSVFADSAEHIKSLEGFMAQ